MSKITASTTQDLQITTKSSCMIIWDASIKQYDCVLGPLVLIVSTSEVQHFQSWHARNPSSSTQRPLPKAIYALDQKSQQCGMSGSQCLRNKLQWKAKTNTIQREEKAHKGTVVPFVRLCSCPPTSNDDLSQWHLEEPVLTEGLR